MHVERGYINRLPLRFSSSPPFTTSLYIQKIFPTIYVCFSLLSNDKPIWPCSKTNNCRFMSASCLYLKSKSKFTLSTQMSGQYSYVLQMCCSDAYVWLFRLSAQNPGIYSITRVMACSKVIYKQRCLLLTLPVKN